MKKLKLYLETSVWNFLLADDTPELQDITLKLFNEIAAGKYEIFISDLVITEINRTKDKNKRDMLL
ncbi:MAG: PIN domain nuclease, partial [candidate division WOR-3 bacterium]|nr:PIN domain nuclease [candidate division WOR-3 bacterium]